MNNKTSVWEEGTRRVGPRGKTGGCGTEESRARIDVSEKGGEPSSEGSW